MCQDQTPNAAAAAYPEFDLHIAENRAWLADRGELVVGSGQFCSGRLRGALHCDFGPLDQDKGANQDFALAWWPAETEKGNRPQFVFAMGDGLTTSYRSEHASALACWIAVRALAEAGMAGAAADPQAMARYAFNEAGLTIGRLTDELARDPEASCPAGQFVSTWKYILKKGGLFQTTLTLAWLDRKCFRIAMIGDGGALWRDYAAASGAQRPIDRVLAACDLDTQQVHALGPADRSVREFDGWREEEPRGPFLCALHTDGVGRGLGTNPLLLLDELEALQAAHEENPARRFIEKAIEQRPADFADNLTLAFLRVE